MLTTVERNIVNLLEANATGTLSPLIRPSKAKKKIRESMSVLSNTDGITKNDVIIQGPVMKCVLITEGLGNRVNMNYYGPEAIESGPAIFEGKPCFIDHMSESESKDLPERSVKAKCGYFKGVHVESLAGKKALVGEIHFDLSKDGERAYQKALTALHYKKEFPQLESEYVGLSIAANGERVSKSMRVQGELLDVNYVTRFTEAMSCDIVTDPARGGRFVALVESAAGVILNTKESKMIVKKLEAARTALQEAIKDEKLSEESKTLLTEADSSLEELLQEATVAADKAKKEEADIAEAKKKEAKKKEGKKKEASMKGCEDESEESDADDDDDDKDAKEAKQGFLVSLLKESGIPEKLCSIDRLMKLSLAEAKAEIEEKKALVESIRESNQFIDVNGGAPLVEAGKEKTLNSLFAGCTQ